MGFRHAALDLPNHLRQWHGLGLRTIYSDTPVAERLAASGTAQDASQVKEGRFGQARDSRAAHMPPNGSNLASKAQTTSAKPSTRAPGQKGRRNPAQETPRSTPKPGLGPVVPSVVTSGKVHWEEPWTTYLNRVPNPCATIWTYWELGGDLSLEPHQGRKAILARLIRKLGWPKGSIGFFPVNEIRDNKPLAKAPMFWAGVKKVGAKHVFSFGRRSLMSICPDRTFRYGSVTLGDVRLHILPELDDLVREQRDAMLLVWNALSSIEIL